jgi:hypothetical protein
MAKLSDHLRLALLIDGVYQVKPSQIRVQLSSNNQAVETLEGLAGKTPGSGRCTISGTCAAPIGGPEHDFFTNVVEGSYHEMQVPFGVKSYIGNGWFDECEIGQSNNANTEVTFTWIGEFNKPK